MSFLSRAGVGTLFTVLSRATWAVHYRWQAAKINQFHLKVLL